MKRIEKIAREIRDKQNELKLVSDEGSIKVAEQLEREIDGLQKDYNNIKGTAAADEEVPAFDELKPETTDPTLEQQINFMFARAKGTTLPTSDRHDHAIYKSLLALKTLRSVGEEALGELKEAITLPEDVMRRIPKPFDLVAQQRFIEGLAFHLGTPTTELQHHLLNMYERLLASIGQCKWVADATAEWLLRQPGQVANEERTMRVSKDGDIGVYVQHDKVDGSYLATFEDWCDEGEISGEGSTYEEAVTNLFKAKDKKRQTVLFPEGGDHD